MKLLFNRSLLPNMASKEHKECAQILKNVHSSLRKLSNKYGYEIAWSQHCSEKDTLKQYADAMKVLGAEHWERNAADPSKSATSRISWVINYCTEYYFHGGLLNSRAKDLQIATKLNITLALENDVILDKLNVLDVGSCYNPFKVCPFMNVLPVDLYPAPESGVFICDFLDVNISKELISDNRVDQLTKQYYDVIVFSLLLEYLPASSQRKLCCEKAYELLKFEGILIIITPDSKHVGANAKIMKNWRYTLALMGFSRVKYEKLPYLHCMVFRKAHHPSIARRWAELHKEPYMEDEIAIPQDSQIIPEDADLEDYKMLSNFECSNTEDNLQVFSNLPNDFD